MKTITLITLFLLLCVNPIFSTQSTMSGDYDNPINWENNNTPDDPTETSEIIGNNIITKDGDFVYPVNIIIHNGSTLIIDGDFFTNQNNQIINVLEGGKLIISGSIYTKGYNITIINNGYLEVGYDIIANCGVIQIGKNSNTIVMGELKYYKDDFLTKEVIDQSVSIDGVSLVIYLQTYGSINLLNLDRSIIGGTINHVETLPIKLTEFNVIYNSNNIKINWITESENNNEKFEIEHSEDGIIFNKIGSVNGMGNSSNTNNYTYLTNNYNSGINYYRLKQIDYDGKFNYSNIYTIIIDNLEPSVLVNDNSIIVYNVDVYRVL